MRNQDGLRYVAAGVRSGGDVPGVSWLSIVKPDTGAGQTSVRFASRSWSALRAEISRKMRATARPAAKLSAPAVVLVIPRTRRIAQAHEDQVQRQSPGAPVAVEEGMHLLKGVVQPGERPGQRLARTGASQVASRVVHLVCPGGCPLPPPRSTMAGG